MGHNIVPYAISHTRTGYPICIWDVPYAYGPIYAYVGQNNVNSFLYIFSLFDLVIQTLKTKNTSYHV